ncbi:fasciclin domain-containing protein [Oscillatoria sp. FACHB-1407]|uniref:fasciclin domain-containing protein n=1 Tax=Oscillatoria sp. FACHB-1407 TaxID=2692847 RepID=UPI0016868E8D|nr:fasciclin domain-containing protein [Oscillatoria sp. FACHB-1407]MBD2463766.1 fasciclin domain-containing protein [Oscillatoria sp. FACHB-1407]
MKSSLKLLIGLASAVSFVVGAGFSASAQTSSVDSLGNQAPGSGSSSGSVNSPSNMGDTTPPRTDRLGNTPGTTNDPSYNQQPSNQQPNNQPSNNQPFNNQPFNSQRVSPQAQIEVPSSAGDMSIDQIVSESSSFELFNALLRVANIEDEGLVQMLGGEEGSYVVYAPTDEAFAALPPEAIKTLVQPENRDLLVELLSYHIVPEDNAFEGIQASTEGEASENAEQAAPAVGEVDSPSQLSDSTSSLSSGSSDFPRMRTDRTSGGMMVNEARVIGTNIQANNGSIYPVDRVILPSELQSELGDLGVLPTTGTPSAISPNESSPSPGFSSPSQRPF